MQASKVPITGTDLDLVVQGFKGGEGIQPYVFVQVLHDEVWSQFDGELTPENAHILSEEIRKHAEWSASL